MAKHLGSIPPFLESGLCGLELRTPNQATDFAYGYPAEIFDAPCCNLAGCRHLKWTAYTYLVDLPSNEWQ